MSDVRGRLGPAVTAVGLAAQRSTSFEKLQRGRLKYATEPSQLGQGQVQGRGVLRMETLNSAEQSS
jgi:hypothetical protein